MDKFDFVKAFDDFSVYYFEKGWVQTNVPFSNDDGSERVYQFTLTEKTDLYLDLDFWSPRMYPTGC